MKAMLDQSAQAFERINATAHQLQASARSVTASASQSAAPKKTTTARSKKA